eukprot:PhF_6_TR25342/c0_g1_i1/m.35054
MMLLMNHAIQSNSYDPLPALRRNQPNQLGGKKTQVTTSMVSYQAKAPQQSQRSCQVIIITVNLIRLYLKGIHLFQWVDGHHRWTFLRTWKYYSSRMYHPRPHGLYPPNPTQIPKVL